MNMRSAQTFGIGDVTIRDCRVLFKSFTVNMAILGIIFGLPMMLVWGYISGSEFIFGKEPISGLWQSVPMWLKQTIVVVFIFLLARGLAAEMLDGIGNALQDFSRWMKRSTFKRRLLATLAVAAFVATLTYLPYVWFVAVIVISSAVGAFQELKTTKLDQMIDGDV